ncbi:MAG TPA: hypothetical protein VHG52_04775 [Thermomicrobiales bacterium]|nr:hypothetical protein [Thermomicrobiales bacterium]
MTRDRILLGSWAILFVSALAFAALVFQGVLRDTRYGEPVQRLELAADTDWLATPFRVWGAGRHRLILSSVNHEARLVGRSFDGEIEVRVVDPDGRVVLQRAYPPGSTGHSVPANYGDVTLDAVDLDDWPFRRWALLVRVSDGDPGFEDVRSEIKLRKERPDLGMGGMINYVMIVPAGILLILATLVAVPLARMNTRTPLILSVLSLLGFAVFLR